MLNEELSIKGSAKVVAALLTFESSMDRIQVERKGFSGMHLQDCLRSSRFLGILITSYRTISKDRSV